MTPAKKAPAKKTAPVKKAVPTKKALAKKTAPVKKAVPTKKAPAKKTPAKKAPAKKTAPAKKAPAKKAPAKKAPAKKAPAKKAPAKKAPAKKAPAKKAPAKKAPAKKAPAKKAPAKKASAKKTAPVAKVAEPKAPPAKPVRKVPVPKPIPPLPAVSPYASDEKFIAKIIEIIEEEKARFASQQAELLAEAQEIVADDNGPREVQFDDESGEGANSAVERDKDLTMANQLLDEIEKLDEALGRIKAKKFGMCEKCHKKIPKERLEAMPFATLHVECAKPSFATW
jgi:RNA polymerase-binding transcription factor DksA